jgi:hypothetical protein
VDDAARLSADDGHMLGWITTAVLGIAAIRMLIPD